MRLRSGQGHLLRWSAVALWATLIFVMSSVPGSRVPGRFGSLAHFVEYAVLAILLLRALQLSSDSRLAPALAIVLASAYGITDELHQWFVPLRVSDPVDWLVDTLGASTGVLCYVAVSRIANARRRH